MLSILSIPRWRWWYSSDAISHKCKMGSPCLFPWRVYLTRRENKSKRDGKRVGLPNVVRKNLSRCTVGLPRKEISIPSEPSIATFSWVLKLPFQYPCLVFESPSARKLWPSCHIYFVWDSECQDEDYSSLDPLHARKPGGGQGSSSGRAGSEPTKPVRCLLPNALCQEEPPGDHGAATLPARSGHQHAGQLGAGGRHPPALGGLRGQRADGGDAVEATQPGVLGRARCARLHPAHARRGKWQLWLDLLADEEDAWRLQTCPEATWWWPRGGGNSTAKTWKHIGEGEMFKIIQAQSYLVGEKLNSTTKTYNLTIKVLNRFWVKT